MPWLGVLGRGSRFWRKDQSLSGTRFSPVTTMTTTRISLVALLVISLVDLLVFNAIHNANNDLPLIAALKQHYERYHAEDLAALKELYEYHAENCVKAAELTEDTPQREEYLKLARAWAEAATTLTSRPRGRRATRNPRKWCKRS